MGNESLSITKNEKKQLALSYVCSLKNQLILNKNLSKIKFLYVLRYTVS